MFPFDPIPAAKRAVALARSKKLLPLDEGPVGDMVRDAIVEGIPQWVNQSKGHVYLAHNVGWPGVHKVGCTRLTVAKRMQALNSEGVPTPWEPIQTWAVYDAHGLEALVHRACHLDWLQGELFGSSPAALASAVDAVIARDLQMLDALLTEILGDSFSNWRASCEPFLN